MRMSTQKGPKRIFLSAGIFLEEFSVGVAKVIASFAVHLLREGSVSLLVVMEWLFGRSKTPEGSIHDRPFFPLLSDLC
jgi:hypothetical protein